MINNTSLLLIISAALSTPLNGVSAHKKSSSLYTLKLKPHDEVSICRLNPTDLFMSYSEAGVKASKHFAYCQSKYERCIHRHGSGKISPSMTQCAAWKNYCDAQGVWPGPSFLSTDKDENDEIQYFH